MNIKHNLLRLCALLKPYLLRLLALLKFCKENHPRFFYSVIAGVVLFLMLLIMFPGSCGGDSSLPAKTERRARVERPEKPHRLRNINYKREFNDMNDAHLGAAQKIGIKPLEKRAAVADVSNKLVEISGSKSYIVDKLTHSQPFLVPEAAALLAEIGESFQDSLVVHHYSPYKIIVTSVLRTDEDVKKLSKRNVNASKRSVHCYGTTFDITYKRFHRLDDDLEEISQAKLKAVLGEVLSDLKKQGRCYVKHEVKQACFHITTRK